VRSLLIRPLVLLVCLAALPLTARAGQLTLEYHFDRPQVTTVRVGDAEFHRVRLPGATNGGPVGSPALPVSPARILIPYGVEPASVEVISDETVLLGSELMVEPVPRPFPLTHGPGSVGPAAPDPAFYDVEGVYPESAFQEIGVQPFRGYQILVLRLQPVHYEPTSGELSYSPRLRVVIETEETDRAPEMLRGFDGDATEVRRRVDNPAAAASYEAAGVRASRAYDLLILTTDALAPSFATLETYHDANGVATEIRTLTDVGSSDPADIRDYIRTAYLDDGIDYVLIGGDDNVVPAQDLYVDSLEGYVEDEMPGDLYYGCLDGSWNGDGDGRFGEPNDGDGGGDVDMAAEVFVGRCAAGSAADVDRFVTKTIWYMSGSHSMPAEVLLVGEYLGFGGVSDYAAAALEELEDGSSASGYTTVGIPTDEYQVSELFERDGSWSQGDLASAINDGLHILNHLGHGDTNYAMKFYNSDVMSELDNTELLFLYSQTCLAGHFDGGQSWAETMNVKTDYGAFALVMNARYGVGANNSTDGPSQRFNREFWDAVFDEAMPEVSRANQDSKDDNLYRINEPFMRWVSYELNLFGDPTVAIQGAEVTGMKVTPRDAFDAEGMSGGPFAPMSKVFTIENLDAAGLDFTVSATQDWIDLSSTGGHLPAGGSTTVTVSINAAASSLPNGMYADTVTFTNTTNHDGDTVRAVNLQVGVPTQQHSWDMSSDPGWTTEGLWAWGQPTGGGGEYGNPDPTGGFTGANVYGYDLSGDYANGLPETHLTTPAIDCSHLGTVSVKFQRHLNVEQPTYDHAYLRVSTDGVSWSDVWDNTTEVTDAAWTEVEYDISSVAAGQPEVYLRWTMGTTDGGWRYSGWNIDDVEVWGLDLSAPPFFADGFESGDTSLWSQTAD